MVSSDITRVPVRLAQEDGSTIELDVTAMDIVVERSNSQIAVPFRDGQRFGIDMNMPQISVALTGVLVDDEGTNTPTEGAKAAFDFASVQFNPSASNAGVAQQVNITNGRQQNLGGGGGQAVGAWLPTTPLGVYDSFSAVKSINDLDKLYFELPVDYLTSGTGQLGAPSRPHGVDASGNYDTGIALHLDAGQGLTTSTVSGFEPDIISQWADQSTHNRHATQSTNTNKPWLLNSSFNGHPAISFSSNASLSISGAGAALNPEEYTIFVVFQAALTTDADGPILGNKESGSDKGYNLFSTANDLGDSTRTVRFRTFDSGGAEDIAFADNTFDDASVLHIVTAQVSGSAGSQVVTVRDNGLTGATTSSLTLIERTSGDFQIGLDAGTSASDNFAGRIAEILIYSSALSNDNLLKNEAYLANKYNITLDPEHTYYGANAASQATHIRFILDALSKGTVKEPHYYLNHQRTTNLVVSGYNAATGVVTFSSGDPREWFELTNQPVRVAKDATSAYFGIVTTITSSTITVLESANASASTRPSATDTLYIAPWRTVDMQHKPDVEPIISIPVRDLLTPHYSETYQNVTERDMGGALNAAEAFTHRVAAAIASSESLGSNALIEAGGTSSGSVFSVKQLIGPNGYRTRLEIEQRRKIDVTTANPTIVHSMVVGNDEPIVEHFTGSRAGNFIKSAGDKAQDLIGILNNSQNFFKGNKTNAPSWLSTLENIYSNHIYNVGAARDYIHGIQIPYMSTVNRDFTMTVDNAPIGATASAATDSVISSPFQTHNLIVGDMIEVTDEYNSPIVSLMGTHVVKSVTSPTEFTIELDTSTNRRTFGTVTYPFSVNILFKKVVSEPYNVPYVQRNFFLTTGTLDTLDKTSVRNMTPAKTAFDITQDGHRKSGIQIAVDEFNVNFNAEDRLYEFDMTMLAVDYLL